MFRFGIACAVILASASLASAAPSLSFTTSSVGNGLTAYDFTVNGNDAASSSFFATITFSTTGTINQIKFNGTTDVNDVTSATNFDNVLGYSKAQDSWFYTPWSSNVVTPPGITLTSSSYAIAAGTGGGSQLNSALFAHIVSSSPVSWSGTISRTGTDFTVSGSTAPVPEPASLAVLSLASMTLLARRRAR